MMNQYLSPYPLKDTVAPFANVNQRLVNVDASNWPGSFGSNETSLQFGLPAIRNNVHAAAASALQKGGSKTLRKKIKNVAKKYKMPQQKRKTMRKRLKSRMMKLKGGYLIGKSRSRKSRIGRRSRSSRRSTKPQYGGVYHQYGSQIPNTPSYSTPGFHVGAKDLALANPPPYQRIGDTSQCTDCIDNYNHYTNKGFQFW